ncbi:hypothetical protein [Nocardia flavorosea]|uniref:Uncharacterized protein n=1 Tax=Nocardia flavorosea TaxID=53429 RepID=A0A846YS90_9NOCA|nr:hypothetical protein [Nocardia flavorosea]NKY60420.1 hypothetical protein [Nocardia flavorosea]
MRNTRYSVTRAQFVTAGKAIRNRYLHAAYRPTLTIGLAVQAPGTRYRTGLTNVFYGLGRGQLSNRGQMAVTVTHGRASLTYTSDQANGPAERVIHGDVLLIGDTLYRVHCPADYRATMPALHRI